MGNKSVATGGDTLTQRFVDAMGYLSPGERLDVLSALKRVKEWHKEQSRESGDPYVFHPIATAEILARLECGPSTLIAGLLHDVVEDGAALLTDVEREFGADISKLVDAVTKLTKLRYEGRRHERQIDSLRKMLLAAADDLRVIFVKLADRLHNVETLTALRPDKQTRIARETLDIYVPFARLTGLWWIKRRFEQICFPIAFGREALEWAQHVQYQRDALQDDREKFFDSLRAAIRFPVDVSLSAMSDYELFLKCNRNPGLLADSSFFDSILVILTDPQADEDTCYRVLGRIHRAFPIKSASLRDFINQPLPNGYRALHTTVFLRHNHTVRVRIQTRSMHEYATMRKYSTWAQDKRNDLYIALHRLHRRFHDHEEYMAELQNDVLQEKIAVFTPAGEIVMLPHGSTGIDLAFALNPDFLSSLSAVRVDGMEWEATSPLHDGETVELVLSEKNRNHAAILRQHARTGSAREAMRDEAEKLPNDTLIADGRTILTHECGKRRLPIRWLFNFSPVRDRICAECREPSFDTLLRRVGAGFIPADRVVSAYNQALLNPSSWVVRVIKWMNFLPQSRVPDPGALIVQLEVVSEDHPGMMCDITRCFAERGMNISDFSAHAFPPGGALYKITLEVSDFGQFSDLYDALLQVSGVKSVLRKK